MPVLNEEEKPKTPQWQLGGAEVFYLTLWTCRNTKCNIIRRLEEEAEVYGQELGGKTMRCLQLEFQAQLVTQLHSRRSLVAWTQKERAGDQKPSGPCLEASSRQWTGLTPVEMG
jgi:hypothetical protein